MKKTVLNLSITAAIGVLGLAGSAQAMTAADTGGSATTLNFTSASTGHMLLVPYYTAQTKHATLFSVVNTDTTNGKAVKIRFRGAANSDDVYDFQVFLSPGDVWNANVSQDLASGLAKLTTSDKSCTKPDSVNGTFVTARLKSTWTDAVKANNTREGYVEIFNMADVPPTIAATGTVTGTIVNPLFTATKHVAGAKPPCASTVTAWTALDTDKSVADYRLAGLANPTRGLLGSWTIINVDNASAWGASTPAIVANGSGNMVYFPQTASPVATSQLVNFTADPLLQLAPIGTSTVIGTTALVTAALYDLPDMSTPYLGAGTPSQQAIDLTQQLAATSVMNEYSTDIAFNATTDWVVSMPTRRYAAAVNYTPATSVAVYNANNVGYFASTNTTMSGDQLCVTGVTAASYDREEQTPVNPTNTVISPNTLAAPTLFCGEASVITINNPGAAQSGVINGSVALKDIAANAGAYKEGWLNIMTPGAVAANGLPILGGAFMRATSGASTFGANWDHRFTRPAN